MLKAVRTAYNIFLLAKKNTNQAVAQSTIRQMIDHIFGRITIPAKYRGDFASFMERGGRVDESEMNATTTTTEGKKIVSATIPEEGSEEEDEESTASVDASSAAENDPVAETSTEMASHLVNEIVERATTPVDQLETKSGERKETDGDEKKKKDATASSEHSKEPVKKSVSKDELKVSPAPAPTEDPDVDGNLNVLIADAFLIFRALCRLSIKAIPEGSTETKSYALKSKILSLHLLNHIVQNHFLVISSIYRLPAPVTERSKEEAQTVAVSQNFVQAVKNHLCVSLSRNAVSLVPEVLDRSLEIFLKLVLGMRHYLKVGYATGV